MAVSLRGRCRSCRHCRRFRRRRRCRWRFTPVARYVDLLWRLRWLRIRMCLATNLAFESGCPAINLSRHVINLSEGCHVASDGFVPCNCGGLSATHQHVAHSTAEATDERRAHLPHVTMSHVLSVRRRYRAEVA